MRALARQQTQTWGSPCKLLEHSLLSSFDFTVHPVDVPRYETLLQASHNLSEQLRKQLPSQHSPSASTPPRIGLYAAPGPEYVLGTLAIWQAGGITVPLATSHPPAELDYVFQDAGLSMVGHDVRFTDWTITS